MTPDPVLASPSVPASLDPRAGPAFRPSTGGTPPTRPRGAAARGWDRHRRCVGAPALQPDDSAGAPGAPHPAPEPVRLLRPTVLNPFAPGQSVVFARASGRLLERLGVRDGDHVALERTPRAEHGDLAAVADLSGRSALWRVYPEGEVLRLSTGDPAHARRTTPRPIVHGVVVGVLRKF